MISLLPTGRGILPLRYGSRRWAFRCLSPGDFFAWRQSRRNRLDLREPNRSKR